MGQSDWELIVRWRAGDHRASEQLFRRHLTSVRDLFRRKAGSDVDDLVQQTLLACVEAQHRYRGDASFKTFLLAIARHVLFAHYSSKSVSSRHFHTERIDPDLFAAPAPARDCDGPDLIPALESLPRDLQLTVRLACWGELSGPEIAKALNVPVNTVYSRLRRARDLLLRRTKCGFVEVQ